MSTCLWLCIIYPRVSYFSASWALYTIQERGQILAIDRRIDRFQLITLWSVTRGKLVNLRQILRLECTNLISAGGAYSTPSAGREGQKTSQEPHPSALRASEFGRRLRSSLSPCPSTLKLSTPIRKLLAIAIRAWALNMTLSTLLLVHLILRISLHQSPAPSLSPSIDISLRIT